MKARQIAALLALVTCAPVLAHGGMGSFDEPDLRYADSASLYYQGGLDHGLWQGPHATRSHRSSMSDGFFGHGRLAGGATFGYDRGYPYDYYSYQEVEEPEPEPRSYECSTQWVPDSNGRGAVPVRICR